MDDNELAAAIERGHDEFLKAVERLDEAALVQPGVAGEWSVKDIMAHISRWEAELVGMLFQIERGHKPTTAQFRPEAVDAVNAKWHLESKDRPLERVWADFEGVHEQLLRRLEQFSAKDLDNPKCYAWLKGKPLASYIAADSFEHNEEHAADIRAWRKKHGL